MRVLEKTNDITSKTHCQDNGMVQKQKKGFRLTQWRKSSHLQRCCVEGLECALFLKLSVLKYSRTRKHISCSLALYNVDPCRVELGCSLPVKACVLLLLRDGSDPAPLCPRPPISNCQTEDQLCPSFPQPSGNSQHTGPSTAPSGWCFQNVTETTAQASAALGIDVALEGLDLREDGKRKVSDFWTKIRPAGRPHSLRTGMCFI